MRVELSFFVEPDLDEIAAYIAADNPVRATTFIDEIESYFRKIGENPRLYQVRNDIFPSARIAVYGHYVIVFRMIPETDTVRIERVVHGSRSMASLVHPEGYTGEA